MDERLVETMLLLPENSFGKGLFSGISDREAMEGFAKRIGHMEMTSIHELGHAQKTSFDVAVSFFEAAPGAGQVRKVFDAVRPGGTVIVVMPSGYFRLPRISRIFPGARVYGLSPSLDDLRLAVPIENSACAAASLALYQPSLKRAKLRKAVAYYLARLGLTMVWVRWLMLVWRTESPDMAKGLFSLFRERFGEEIELALFTGTPGYLRKPTVQIMDASGGILGYCKVAINSQTKEVVENEARTLELLSSVDLGPATVPELIHCGGLPDGTTVLVQSTKKEHLSAAPLSPGRVHADFLARLFKQTRQERQFLESPPSLEVRKKLSRPGENAGEGLMRQLLAAFEWSSGTLESAKIPLCLAHRDFTPWNTFLAGERLYVFDWEFARSSWIPLADAFHFVLQKGILVDHAEEGLLWERLTGDASEERRFLRNYVADTGIGESAYRALLAFYLVDMITTYLVHYEGYGQVNADGQELLARWKGLLARVMEMEGSSSL
jgi:hypothetical protein